MVICFSSNRELTHINHDYNIMTTASSNNKTADVYSPLIICLQQKNVAQTKLNLTTNLWARFYYQLHLRDVKIEASVKMQVNRW